jgi:hypothetical protein
MSGHLVRRAAAIAAALAAAGLAPAAATAQAPAFRDRVLRGPVAQSAGLRGAAPETAYRAPDGQVVMVRISNSVSNGPAVAQQIVNFLGSRVHGLELGRLRIFIGTPVEIQSTCGGDERVLACYAPGERRMYVPDRDPPGGTGVGFTRDYAVTHEYGHHIGRYRSNFPWPALDWGAKYWSSYEFVCAGVQQGRYFPGDQGENYLKDPGEAFADAYAHMHYPDVPWQFEDSLRPDAGALAALRRDVLTPWQGNRRRTFRATLRPGLNIRATTLTLTLDGRLDLRLAGPRGSNYDVALYQGSRLVTRTRVQGSHDRLILNWCRSVSPTSGLSARVIRRSGAGAFTLTVLYPG